MTFSSRRRTFALVGILLANFCGAANAVEPTARIIESHDIWDSSDTVKSTDIVRFRDEWICVMQTDAGLRLIASKDGKGRTWRQLSMVTSSNKNFPLRDPRLTVTHPGKREDLRGRLMLTAVASHAPCGGYSKTWLSKDFYGSDVAIEWQAPESSAEGDYLVSSVFWHVGVAYNFQCGSSCGSATTIRISASDNGKQFEDRFEETFSGGFPLDAALVFSQDDGFCVMPIMGKRLHALLGVSKAPFYSWQWKKLPKGLKHPNAIRTKSGIMLVVAGLAGDQGKLQTTLCALDPETPQLVPLVTIPTSRSCYVGLANHEDQVFLTYHTRTDTGSSVYLAKVSIENQ